MRHCVLREDMRDTILDAVERLIERYGYRKMTMEDVAREAGIGKGTIYLHFPSKEDVALSAVDRITRRIQERLREIARSHGAPVERLRQMLVMRVMLRFDSVQHFSQSLDEMFLALRSAFLARRERMHRAEAEIFAEALIEGRLLGAFCFEDALQTAHTLLLATNALLPLNLSPRELGAREDVREKAARLADLLLAGVLSREKH
jgi:AcrR family transcriptional regulator